jgi:hypothetical protein
MRRATLSYPAVVDGPEVREVITWCAKELVSIAAQPDLTPAARQIVEDGLGKLATATARLECGRLAEARSGLCYAITLLGLAVCKVSNCRELFPMLDDMRKAAGLSGEIPAGTRLG